MRAQVGFQWMNVTVLDSERPHSAAQNSFKAALIGRERFDIDWPSIADDRDVRMYVYQSREFLNVWMNTIGRASGIECSFVVVKDRDGQPVLYLPFAVETKFNVRFLRFMDCGVADYNAPIVHAGRKLTQQEFHAIWPEILALLPDFDVVDLKKIASDASGALNPLTYLACSPHSESGHVLRLVRSPDGNGAPSTSLKQKLGRELRKLGETHAVEFIVNPTGPTAEEFIKKLFDLKRQKYQETDTADFLDVPGVADFYRQIASPQQLGKIGHLSALVVDNVPVSAHLGFIGRDRFYYIMPAYDAAYARHRPGHLLLNYLVDQTTKQGFETLDLGVGDEAYKISWATGRVALYDHQYAMTAAGHVYLQMRRIRRFVKSGGIRTWFRRAG
ncbi:MAG TPA: GNAT family N-acetyltransferase [Acetobacteraceae bacterium]|nr:GNAT family N-acetyltransferase [Acetobacteraceae bacterium]